MRHRMRAGKLGRTGSHRVAMYRNMVTSLLEHERIRTTDAKAKEVRRLADKMITLGKRGDLHARRRALRVIRRREVAAKVFDDLAERYRDRAGGYTRVVKLRNRRGDAAPVSIVELVERAAVAPRVEAKRTAKATPRKGKGAAAKDEKSAAAAKKALRKKKAEGEKKTSRKKKTAAQKAETKKKAPAKKASAKKKTSSRKKSSRKKSD